MSVGADGAVVGVFGGARAAGTVRDALGTLTHRGALATLIGGRAEALRAWALEPPDGDGSTVSPRGSCAVGVRAPRAELEGRVTRPVVARTEMGPLGLAIAGRLVNARSLERELLGAGAVLAQGSDAELLLHLVARSHQRTLINRLVDALQQARGGFALLLTDGERLVAVRDPLGLRPLLMGRAGARVIVASESRAIEAVGGRELREIDPGEMVILDHEGGTSLYPFPRREPRPCVRELVAVARHDSVSCGMSGYEVRTAIGDRLAREQPASADLVAAMTRASAPAALGFALCMGLPFYPELFDAREADGADGERSLVAPVVRGKRVVVVHDSIGPEAPWSAVVRALEGAGAREVHARLAGPPTRFPCLYGVALMPSAGYASTGRTPEEIRVEMGADSFGWLELGPLLEAVQSPIENLCDGCYSGHYPLVHEDLEQPQLPLFEG